MAPLRRTANVDIAATARADGDLKLTAVEEAITVTADAPYPAASVPRWR